MECTIWPLISKLSLFTVENNGCQWLPTRDKSDRVVRFLPEPGAALPSQLTAGNSLIPADSRVTRVHLLL